MNNVKTLTKENARKATGGIWAVLAALMFTVIAGATGVITYSECGFEWWGDYILTGILAINALCAWLIVFCRNTAGLVIAKVFKIIEIVAAAVVAAAAAIILIESLTGTEIAGDLSSAISMFGAVAGIGAAIILGIAIIVIVYLASALGAISAASAGYRNRPVGSNGRFFSVLSFIAAVLFAGIIPLRIFFESIAEALYIDTSVIKMHTLSLDFSSYTMADYAIAAQSVAIPLFFLFVAIAACVLAGKVSVNDSAAEPAAVDAAVLPEKTEVPAEATAVVAASAVAADYAAENEEPVVSEEIPAEEIEVPAEAKETMCLFENSEEVPEKSAVEKSEIEELAVEAVPEIDYEKTQTDFSSAEDFDYKSIGVEFTEPVAGVANTEYISDEKAEEKPEIKYIPGTHMIDFEYSEDTIL